MEEIAKSLKAALYERMGSSLLGSFVVFWTYLNWKAIAILIASNASIIERIAEIESKYTNPSYNYWYPLLYASIFSLAYPYVSVLPYLVSKHAHKIKTSLRNWIEKTITISIEDYNKLKIEIADNDQKISDLLAKRSNRENDLMEEINRLNSLTESLHSKLDERSKRINEIDSLVGARSISAKDTLLNITNELTKLVSTNYGEGLHSLTRKVSDTLNNTTISNHHLSTLANWLAHIKKHIEAGIINPSVTETSDYLRDFIYACEQVRAVIKHFTQNNTNMAKSNELSSLKEEWSVVSTKVNNITNEWKRFLLEHYEELGSDINEEFFSTLKPIEYE